MSNLIANALHCGDSGKAVTVKAEDVGGSITVEVHNMGSPIHPSAVRGIFAPMARHVPGDQQIDKNISALGLGLLITSEIVTSHGGSMEVVSNESEGTTFIMRLPRHASMQFHTK
ncbi:MAG: ATP-binding protein [Proteobacteria bacterium]|nr:MAG: ATP-binding protein [Pseudomonadota bacterium]